MFWKRLLSILLTFILLFSSLPVVNAESNFPNKGEIDISKISFFSEASRSLRESTEDESTYISSINLAINSDTMIVDGEEIVVLPPSNSLGSVMLPITDIAEALGAEVDVNETTGEIIIIDDGDFNVLEIQPDTEDVQLYDAEDVAHILSLDISIDGDDIILTRPFQSKILLVRMQSGKKISSTYGASDYITDGKGQYVLKYDSISQTKQAYDAIRTLSGCQNVTPNLVVSTYGEPSDGNIMPFALPGSSWGTERIRAGLMKDYLVNNGKTGTNFIVAVLDTGADSNHPHLAGRTVSGRNFSETNKNDYNWTMDGNNHGTHVSGTIIDCTPENVKIMPVKVLNDDGYGYDTDIAEGIIWAANNGAKVINMSLGGVYYGDNPDWNWVEREACEYAVTQNVTVVVAAGNENIDTKHVTPAGLASVITVAATDQSDTKANFSNYGDAVDVSAPGVYILSSISGGGYQYYQGTSMASPHVSAVAAMLIINTPSLSPEDVRTTIRSSSIDLGVNGWDRIFGAGVIDLRKYFGTLTIPSTYMSVWPTSITIPNSAFTSRTWIDVYVGDYDATDKSFTVTSTNENVAVYIDGCVVPKGIGNTTLTFKTANNHVGTCEVTVIESFNWVDYAADAYAGGTGTENDPYLIATPEQLAKLSYQVGVNGNLYQDEYFKLIADIDLDGYYWSPIVYVLRGSGWVSSEGFMGNFDGNNHAISNMKIIRQGTDQTSSHLGLFGAIGDGGFPSGTHEIKSLAVLNADVGGNRELGPGIGIICGNAGRGTIISNCFTTGKVSGSGLIGGGAATITNCFSTADVYTDVDSIGSLTNSLGSNVVGVVGSIYNSYYSGNIISNNETDSGFIAYANGENIVNSFSTSYVPNGNGFSYKKNRGSIIKCYYLADNPIGIKEDLAADATNLTPKDLSFFKNKATYSNSVNWDSRYPWDFENVWAINDNINNGLPYLKGFPVSLYEGNQNFIEIIPSEDISGILNGTPKTVQALGLPSSVLVVTDNLPCLSAFVTWDIENSSYNPALITMQTFTVNGLVILPSGVNNPDNKPLTTYIQVRVESVANLLSIKTPDSVIGVLNGVDKTADALGLPSTVQIIIDNLPDVPANVLWDVASSSYDPSIKTEQNFTVHGTITLPNGVQNISGIPLITEISVTVERSYNWIDWAADSFEGGDGTQNNPYLIASANQLAKLAKDAANGNSYAGEYIKLTADVDLNEMEWTPIGLHWNIPFSGSFDGNYHCIANMKINTKNNWVGLFGYFQGYVDEYTNGASIKNLAIINAIVESTSENSYVGILGGGIINANISNCYTTGKSSGSGLIGYIGCYQIAEAEYPTEVRNCYSTATAGNRNGYDEGNGGLIGQVDIGNVYNSYASGKIISNIWGAGFIRSQFEKGKTINSFAANHQTTDLGFMCINSDGTIEKCYYLADNQRGTMYGEIPSLMPKDMSFFKDKNTYLNSDNWSDESPWDFENVWAINENINDGLPYLKGFPTSFFNSVKIIATGDCGDNITWTLYSDGLLDITGAGDMGNFGDVPWYDYRDSIKTVNISDGITSIRESAFAECNNLVGVTISSSVTSFGRGAFAGCSNLLSMDIPAGATSIGNAAFFACHSLTNIEIPNSVITIGEFAFYGCSNLTSIDIPAGAVSIGNAAFSACKNLENINVAYGNSYYKDIDGVLFNSAGTSIIAYPAGRSGEYTIPADVISIIQGAFAGCNSLTSIIIPSSVTYIGETAFGGCSNLVSINIPDSITSIGLSTFSNCSSLTIINIPDSVTNIGEGAFAGCNSLTSIIIPSGVTYIGESAFYGCSSLYDIYLPAIPPTVGGNAFYSVKSGARAMMPYGSTAYGAVGSLWNGLIVTFAPAIISIPAIEWVKGEQIKIPVNIINNPGLVTFQMNITYDTSVLTPIRVENGTVWNGDIAANLKYAADKIRIAGSSSSMKTGDGAIAYITFDIKETAANGVYPVKLELYVLETLDVTATRQDLPFVTFDGSVNIISILKGDVDLNGTVNAGDATEVLLYKAMLKSLTDKQLYAADTLNRGIDKVEVSDATRILLRSVGLISTLPPPEQQTQGFSMGLFSVTGAKLTLESTAGKPGDVVTVPIDISENMGFSTLKVELGYDNSKLTPVSVSTGNVWSGDLTVNLSADDGDGVKYIIITGASINNSTSDGTIAYVRFKINDDASGTANLNLNIKELKYTNSDYNIVELSNTASNGTITVTGEEIGITVSGTVKSHNPKNAVTIELFNKVTSPNQISEATAVYTTTIEAELSGSGQTSQRFELPNVTAGEYTLRVKKDGHLSFIKLTLIVGEQGIDLDDILDGAITLGPGDINGDGQIDSIDLTKLISEYGKPGSSIGDSLADINGDGQVDSIDLTLLISAYGKSNIVR